MSVLEKILQEIEQRFFFEKVKAHVYENEVYVPLQDILGIIRSNIEDDRWIPVEMKDDEWIPETVLPEEGQKVFVTISYNDNARLVERAYFEDGSFWNNQRIAFDCITKAWMPRFVPAPYQPKPKEQ